MIRILSIAGFSLMAMSFLNPVINGPYTKNIEQHRMFDTGCLILGIVLFFGSLLLRRFKRK